MATANGVGANGTSGASATTDPDDLELACMICQEEYDLDVHLPKMLDICHHTIWYDILYI